MSFELYNSDTKAISITGWKFFEAGTNHRLTLVQGSMVIPTGGYAIIADNATAFLHEHPQCTCAVIDSTFSLHNTEEYIALKNATVDTIDEVTYNASWGANGNNRTLELNATGGWEESRIDGGTPCQRNSVLATPPMVTNASANPPVIAVNTGITELRVDVADIESPIDVVTVDLSPIGENASTVMFNIGNYTQDNISWTMYNYTTNASVKGTFNLTVDATDINGNYNDAVSIMLDVKKTVIPSLGHPSPGHMRKIDIDLSNITFDAIIPSPGNIEEHNKNSWIFGSYTTKVWEFEVYDEQTHWRTKMSGVLDNVTEDAKMERLVTEMEGVEVANLTFDPGFVMLDFPLRLGKNWTTTTNVTGILVNETGEVISIETVALISGEVTDEVDLTTSPRLVIENNIRFEADGQRVSCLVRYEVDQ